MGQATIFAGQKIKTLKSTLSLNGGADIISSTTNPQTSAVSAEPGSLLLNTTSGIMYRKLDAGSTTNWVEVGSGSGGKNYIKNPDFDGGATTNWAMKKVSLSSLVPTGNIGAPDAGHTIAASSSSPLEGANSLLVQGASAFTAGNCLVSDAFAIDRQDQAKVMGWSFYYEAVTANMDFTGTSAGTWAVYIAEVTTATPDTVVSWIQPAGVYNLVQGSGVGIASGTFQTTATGTAYRLVLVCINSEAAATTLKVDDFQLGPQQTVQGAAISDWVSYTPTGSWTSNTSYSGRYRRVGDSVDLQYTLTLSGAPNAANLTLNMPSGMVIDTSKLSSSFIFAGGGNGADVGVQPYGQFFLEVLSSTSFIVRYQSSVTAIGSPVSNTAPFSWGNTDIINLRATDIPISGLSSNTVLSQDTDTRVVAARLFRSTNQSGINPNNSAVKITFNSVTGDTHATFDAVNSRWLAPVSGWYRVNGSIALQSTNVLAVTHYAQLNKVVGGVSSVYSFGPYVTPSSPGIALGLMVDDLIYLNSGEGIELFLFGVGNNSVNTLSTNNGGTLTYLSIERLSGPATIAASETVAMRAYKNTGNHTSTGAWQTVASWNSSPFDTHGAFNITTGEYTVPVSGTYQVSAHIAYLSNITGARGLRIDLDGSVVSGGSFIAALNGFGTGIPATSLVRVLAGQKISLSGWQNGAASLGYETILGFNQFSIVRVGN